MRRPKASSREGVQQRRQPPGEALGLPDPGERPRANRRRARRPRLEVVLAQRRRAGSDVGGGKVQALGAGRRHDVRGVAGQEQPALAHRLGDEGAQRRDRLLERRAGTTSARGLRGQPAAQLVPERVVRPVLDLSVSGTWI